MGTKEYSRNLHKEIRKDCGLLVKQHIGFLLLPLEDKLPPLIFIDSFSAIYGCRSRNDWSLIIVLLEPKTLRLIQITAEFALIQGQAEWTRSDMNFIPFPQPKYTDIQTLADEFWLEHAEKITEVALEVVRKANLGEPILNPRHTSTNHSLVPETFSLN